MTCAYAVRGAFKKFSGVESVDVSLNKGLATVKLQPGNSLMVEQFWDAVKKNGFTPKGTHVVIRGEVFVVSGKTQLRVTGTNRTYDLAADTKSPGGLDEAKRLAGKSLTLDGTLTPGKAALEVERVRP